MKLEFIFIVVIIAIGVHFFGEDKNKTLETTEKKSAHVPTETKKSPEIKKFVRVIFKKGDSKKYDYFLGDNYDIKVGDFVEVWATSRFSGRDKLKIVKVVYISEAGEISYKATKTVVRKSDTRGW